MSCSYIIFRKDGEIVALESLQVLNESAILNRFYESLKLKEWMCELCRFSQIWSKLCDQILERMANYT